MPSSRSRCTGRVIWFLLLMVLRTGSCRRALESTAASPTLRTGALRLLYSPAITPPALLSCSSFTLHIHLALAQEGRDDRAKRRGHDVRVGADAPAHLAIAVASFD